eukprot:1146276-Pelagomonas_calceolata.AAC.6
MADRIWEDQQSSDLELSRVPVRGSPNLTCIHASRDCIRLEEPNLGIQDIQMCAPATVMPRFSGSREYICVAGTVQQAEQLSYLAEGQVPL